MVKSISLILSSCFLLILISCNSATSKQKNNNEQNNGELATGFRPLSDAEKVYYQAEIQKKFDSLFPGDAFNGEILIAKNGEVLFEKYQGYQDFIKKTPITDHTPLHVASVSKTLTAAAILKLYDEKKLDLKDSIQQFFPEFYYKGITIENLLSHRSGLPNYLYAMDKIWDRKRLASNYDIMSCLGDHKVPVTAQPNRAFQYCNTNYILLALIVEKVSGMDFPTYMQKEVFEPIGMTNSFIFSKNDSAHYIPTFAGNRPYPRDAYDGSYGDKNLFTTVRDLLKWDNILYTGNFLKQETIKRAFTGLSNEKPGVHNYGLGWRMINGAAGDTVVYHNGLWHGSNAVFTRLVQDTAVIIIIGNKLNKTIYRGKEFGNIFSDRYANSKAL